MSSSAQLEALLRAGRAERCPEGNEQRLLDALGVGTPASSGAALGTSFRALLRWMGWMVLLGALSAAGLWTIAARGPRLAATTAPPVAVAADARLEVAPVSLSGASHRERGAKTLPPRAPEPPRASPPTATAAVVTSAVTLVDDELARITEARLALRRHDPAAALSTLDAYERACPRGAFREEAAALRVDALVAAGRLSEARSAAEQFATTWPHSAYGPRVDGLRRRMERPE
jgi:hypothetical protein